MKPAFIKLLMSLSNFLFTLALKLEGETKKTIDFEFIPERVVKE